MRCFWSREKVGCLLFPGQTSGPNGPDVQLLPCHPVHLQGVAAGAWPTSSAPPGRGPRCRVCSASYTPDVFTHARGIMAHREWISAGACGHSSTHSRIHSKRQSLAIGERLGGDVPAHPRCFSHSPLKVCSILETFTFIKYMEITYAPRVVLYVERLFDLLMFH